MFRRIFGIGKRKGTAGNNPAGSIKLENPAAASAENTTASVLPLHATVKPVRKKKEAAEIFNEAVEKLVDKLEGINQNLEQHILQNQQLVRQMDGLPEMLAAMPTAVDQQREAFANVAAQLAQKAEHDEKMAEELAGIHEKVAASTEIDAQMSEHFGKFSQTLTKLDQDTVCQTQWLEQLSHSFLASERYMKYTLEKQQRRFYWILGISLGSCLLVVIALIIGVAMLTR